MHFRELTDCYSLDKILRSSRSGTVLRATDARSARLVAVKLMHVASPAELVQRAPQLDKLVAALEAAGQPSLPGVIDSGFTTEGSAFLVMELLDGQTLDTISGPPQRLLALLSSALDGLEALAQRSVAHHNLSPDNLLVVAMPQGERVKILGLGTAIFRGSGPASVETARFRAPELDAGAAADWRADLFAFALTACSVLGATVGPGESPVVQLPFGLTLELEDSEGLRRTLERALRRQPAERPGYQELRDAFRSAMGTGGISLPPEMGPLVETPLPLRLVVPTGSGSPTPAAPASASATPATAAPAASEPAAREAGELLSFDEGLLNDLLPPRPAAAGEKNAAPFANAPPLTAANVVPFQRRPMAAVAASAQPKPPGNPLRSSLVLAGIAVACVVAAGLVYWWLSRGGAGDAAPPAVAATPAPAPPRRPATEALDEARSALGQGEDEHAWEVLRSLTFADQSTLPPEGCRVLGSLEETLALAALHRLPEDLDKGLKTGDLGRLRFAVAMAGAAAARVPEPLRASLDRARAVVELYARVEQAAARKAPVEVLESFSALAQQLPGATDPLDLRAQAAATLEGEAESLARDGKYIEAQSHLDPLQRAWPNRDGLKARLEAYVRYQHNEAQEEAVLAALPGFERRKKPHEGLDMMRGLEPTPHLAAQLDEARKRLEEELAQLDGQPPQVILRDGYGLDYDRGSVVELSFRVTDDYEVKSVKMMARPQGGKMRPVALQASHLGYTATLPPAFHQNGTVDFYVVATDVSGHEGYLGTPDRPLQLKRKQGFQRILR